MSWGDKVFAYCERGGDPGFWAEPLNAISNASFIVAGLLGLAIWLRRHETSPRRIELALILLVLLIGIGSFLFHTFATRWARLADSGPIAIFMISYLIYAIRRYLQAGWMATGIAIALFLVSGAAAASIRCGGDACLNGSVGYLPALAALSIVATILATWRHPAACHLAIGSGIFLVSLAFRSADFALCPQTLISHGWYAGTHAVWHTLNGILLYFLLAAAIRHGEVPATDAVLSLNK